MAAAFYSGLDALLLNRFKRGRVCVLCYHDPAPDVLREHLGFLSRRYTFATLDDIGNGQWPGKGERSWVILTLDDGHVGNYELIPILKQFRVRPTIYLCTAIIDTKRTFWWLVVPSAKSRRKLMRMPNDARLEILRKRYNFSEDKDWIGERKALNRAEIHEMSKYVDFQAHTRFHPILTNCSGERCLEEIAGSRDDLQSLTGRSCIHFSFPNADYTEREIAIVKRCGYKTARTADWGWMDAGHDRFLLEAIHIPDDASMATLVGQLCGIGKLLGALGRIRQRLY